MPGVRGGLGAACEHGGSSPFLSGWSRIPLTLLQVPLFCSLDWNWAALGKLREGEVVSAEGGACAAPPHLSSWL